MLEAKTIPDMRPVDDLENKRNQICLVGYYHIIVIKFPSCKNKK